ncbi:MAG: hypothetical protein U0P82_00340 [Vicinamibacterales bacterium]
MTQEPVAVAIDVSHLTRWFSRVMWLGILANLGMALPTLLMPARMLAWSRLPITVPIVWTQFSALLLVLLSAFYIPAAVDPQRHRAVAWLAVLARLAGVAFFVGLQPREYHLFGYFDLTFFVPEAALLASIASPSAARGLKPTPYESPWRL